MQSVPPLEDLFKMAGMSLPGYLKGNAENQKQDEGKDGLGPEVKK